MHSSLVRIIRKKAFKQGAVKATHALTLVALVFYMTAMPFVMASTAQAAPADPKDDRNTVGDVDAVTTQPVIPDPVTINAYKVVCTDEAELPNWASDNGGQTITPTLVSDWVSSHASCAFASGWQFQWGDHNAANPGDNTGPSGDSAWHTFGPTNGSGLATVVIDGLQSHYWMREAWQSGYIPFTGANDTLDVSAEMLCDTDNWKFDNFDRVDQPVAGETYTCVAFYSPEPTPADLWIEKSDGVETANPGETLEYTITVHNDGDEDANNVVVVDDVLKFDQQKCEAVGEITPPGIHHEWDGNIWWITVNVPAQSSIDLLWECDLTSDFDEGTTVLHNDVYFCWIDHPVGDVNAVKGVTSSDESICKDWGTAYDDTSVTVEPSGEGPDLWVTKRMNDLHLCPLEGECVEDENYKVSIMYGNSGDTTAYNVTITDELEQYWQVPLNITGGDTNGYDSTQHMIWWQFDEIAPGETGQVSATLNESDDPSLYPNAAQGDCTLNNMVHISIFAVGGDGVWSDSNFENNEATASHPHECPLPEFELTVSKDDGLTIINPDGTLTYTIVWTLTSFNPLNNVTIEDTLPYEVSYVSASSTGAYDDPTHTVSWDLGTLKPVGPDYTLTGSETITVNVATPLDTGTPLLNDGNLCYDYQESQTTDHISKICTPFDDLTTVESDFVTTINKVDDVDGDVTKDDTYTYTIDWTLTGDAPAYNVALVDTLPADVTLVANSGTGVYDSSTHAITWEYGDLDPDATGSEWVTVKVGQDVADGDELYNVAALSADKAIVSYSSSTEGEASSIMLETITVTDDETTPVAIPVEPPEEPAETPLMTLDKSVVAADTINAGDVVTYTVTLTNGGNVDLINVQLDDLLDEGLYFSDSPFGTEKILVDGGDLAPGDSTTFTYNVTVASDTAAGDYTNVATASADNHGKLTDTETITVVAGEVLGVEAEPSLTIEKTVNVDFANPGDTVTYSVTVTNDGEADAINVTLTDMLVEGLMFVQGEDLTRQWNLGDLAVDESITVVYDVFVDKEVKNGEYGNVAIASADNADSVQDAVDLPVKSGEVLGEVAKTGASPRDYIIFGSAIVALVGAAVGLRRRFIITNH